MKEFGIPLVNVQKAFSRAIKRRDGRCMVRDYEPCCGGLECSHFFTQGAHPSLMFYPPNAYTQCQRHHWNHHNNKDSKTVYAEWLDDNHSDDLRRMVGLCSKYIKYTDELKRRIMRLCDSDRLDELARLIERELEK